MNYSEINEDLIKNHDFYKEVLKDVPRSMGLLVLDDGSTKEIMSYERSCAFLVASIFTVKYGYPLDNLVEHLEQINWPLYLKL